MCQNKSKIKTWKQFASKVRARKRNLLSRINDYPDCVLITGCQRSGTTMLSRIIRQSEGMVNYWESKDDELDAALLLSGETEFRAPGRYCFQTTYLNENYCEYIAHLGKYRMIWVLRNPFSVVYSLAYNWRTWALNELFQACGAHLFEECKANVYFKSGWFGPPKIIKGCLSYNGKISQLFELKRALPLDSIKVVEYDTIVKNPEYELKKIFAFIDHPFNKSYCDFIHAKSTMKKNQLTEKEHALIRMICLPIYTKASQLLD